MAASNRGAGMISPVGKSLSQLIGGTVGVVVEQLDEVQPKHPEVPEFSGSRSVHIDAKFGLMMSPPRPSLVDSVQRPGVAGCKLQLQDLFDEPG